MISGGFQQIDMGGVRGSDDEDPLLHRQSRATRQGPPMSTTSPGRDQPQVHRRHQALGPPDKTLALVALIGPAIPSAFSTLVARANKRKPRPFISTWTSPADCRLFSRD